MKKRIAYYIIIFLICLPIASVAQNSFNRTQSFVHPEWNQSAVIGLQTQPVAGLAYRQYINEMGTGLSTYEAGFSMPINMNYNASVDNSGFILSSPELQSKIKTNKSSRRKHGFGINMRSLQFDVFQKNEVQLSYAFHLPLTETYNLSIGTSFSYGVSTLNTDNLTVRDPANDLLYQEIVNANGSNVQELSNNFGLAFYSSKLIISGNLNNISIFERGNLADEETTFNTKLQPNFYMSYKWSISHKINLIPNITYQYNPFFGHIFTGNMRVNYNNAVYVGAGIENKYRFSGLLGIKLTRDIFMNYSYDTSSKYGRVTTNGVHELTLSYLFKNKRAGIPYLW